MKQKEKKTTNAYTRIRLFYTEIENACFVTVICIYRSKVSRFVLWSCFNILVYREAVEETAVRAESRIFFFDLDVY